MAMKSLRFIFRLAALTLAPAVAHAGGFVRAPTFDSPPVCSSLTICTGDSDCTGGASCVGFGVQGTYCALPGQDLFCCESGAPCPTIDGVANMCVSVATDSGSIALCLPPDPRVCPNATGGSPTWAQFEACYRSAVSRAAHVYDWEVGDCDGDGITNGRDREPCVPMVDAGSVADVTVVDDAMRVDVVDEATGQRDAGTVDVTTPDASAADASMDAGVDAPAVVDDIPQLTFRGGGCQCSARTGAPEHSRAKLAFLLAALGTVTFSRRRTRRR